MERENRMIPKAHWLSVDARIFAADKYKFSFLLFLGGYLQLPPHSYIFTLYCCCPEVLKKRWENLLQLGGLILNIVQNSITFASVQRDKELLKSLWLL